MTEPIPAAHPDQTLRADSLRLNELLPDFTVPYGLT